MALVMNQCSGVGPAIQRSASMLSVLVVVVAVMALAAALPTHVEGSGNDKASSCVPEDLKALVQAFAVDRAALVAPQRQAYWNSTAHALSQALLQCHGPSSPPPPPPSSSPATVPLSRNSVAQLTVEISSSGDFGAAYVRM